MLPRLNFQLPRFKLYLAPTSQSSWSKRPFHVSLSSSLWTDLLIVAILFRLNEFTLSHLTPGISGFWLPTCVFFAVYDAWETRVLFDSVFKFQDDLFHHFIGILQWLLLALMATAITPDKTWTRFDSILFSMLKLAHQTIRVFNYLETWRYSRSKRARKSARARSLVYLLSWPLYLVVPCLLFTNEVGEAIAIRQDLACAFWLIAFFFQRIIWALLKWDPLPNAYIPFRTDCVQIKTNVPFKTARYSDWTMLQLGAIVLGFMTVPIGNVSAYGTLIFGYVYVGCLNMLSYSIGPQDPAQHALVQGAFREFIWLELFSITGLCLMAIAVGLRVHLFYPNQVVLSEFRHYSWLLGVAANLSAMAMFAQELCHGGQVLRTNRGHVLWYKFAGSAFFTISSLAYVLSDCQDPMYLILGLMLTSILVLTIQVANGAFKRKMFKNEKLKLMGHFRAAVIAMVLLHRARRNLALLGTDISHQTSADTVTVFEQEQQQQLAVSPTRATANKRPSLMEVTNQVPTKPSAQQLAAQAQRLKQTQRLPYHRQASSMEYNNGTGGHLPLSQFSSSSLDDHLPQNKRSNRLSQHMTRATQTGKRRVSMAKQEIRQWKIVVNDKFYSAPHVYVDGNKATKYRVQWSDLFFDVLFVGVVFRLGDLLLSGMGVGYSESSVHFLENVLNSNGTLYEDPVHDEPRSDAVVVFSAVFLAVWGVWQNRLAYGSKVGTGDVLHKVVDLTQGLAVMLVAVNITTQVRMQDKSSGNAYAVAGGLAAIQLSMVLLWTELYFARGSREDSRARGTAARNIQRDLASLLPTLLSFCTIYYEVDLLATSMLWAMSWLFPFAMRVFVLRVLNEHNAVRDLHRYVIHRLGDGALILLGEGVLQIVRAKVLYKSVYYFAAILLGLFSITAVRIAVWSMDCFTDSGKHAQLLSLNAGLAAFLVRSIAGPALVALGVAMKKMVSMSYDNAFAEANREFYWLLCGASFVALAMEILTYELHRFASHGKFRRAEPALLLAIACLFLIWPASGTLPSWAILALCLANWLLVILVHFLLDDYFLLKEQVVKPRGETEGGVGAMSMKSAKTFRKHGLIPAFSAARILRGNNEVVARSKSNRFDKPVQGEKKFYPLVKREDASSSAAVDNQALAVTENPLFINSRA